MNEAILALILIFTSITMWYVSKIYYLLKEKQEKE